jgi:hypothetical protein
MTRIHTSFPRHNRSGLIVRLLPAVVLLGTSVAVAPAANAAPTPSTAAVTNATTGQTDASSVTALNPCGTPTAVRAACLFKVLGVRGTGSLVHPRLRRPASPNRLVRRRAARSRPTSQQAVTAAAAPQPGTPAYLQQVYDLSYLSQTAGANTTVAIVDAFDAPHAEADLAVYRSEFSLPPCTTDNGCFKKIDQTGGTNYPASATPDWEQEISLDLDAVSALCPNCHIVLVEANSAGISDLAAAQQEASQQGPSVISDSWGFALSGRSNVDAFTSAGPYTFQGITTVAASGDDGYLGSRTNYYPAALRDVTAVGGTTLVPDSTSGVQSARGFDEFAWSGTGSGCEWRTSKPTWQTDTGCGGRAYNDLSADGDPLTGMQVYESDAGGTGWVVVGGTSEATALIAAYYALIGSAAQGPSWAYANAALMNDPTAGSNGLCSDTLSYICNARAGYDGPTGVGSISGAVIAGAPGIGGPGPSGSYTESVDTSSAQLQGGVYPNGTDTTYWWEYGTTTSYGQRTPAIDVGAGTAPVSVTDALSGLQPSTTYHYRLVAQNGDGTDYGYDFTLTTASGTSNSSQQGSGGSGTQSTTTQTTTTPTTTGTTPPGDTITAPGTGTSSSAPATPLVARLRVVSAGARTATLTAAVATGGSAASYSLQYGTTSALGRSLKGSLAASSTRLSGTLRHLAPGRTYYVRAVIVNPAGSTATAVIRFRTSRVTITRLAIQGGRLQAALRCYGKAPCRVTLQARSGSRLLVTGRATIGGNRTATVSLPLTAGRHPALKLTVLSRWNGYPAAVTASA